MRARLCLIALSAAFMLAAPPLKTATPPAVQTAASGAPEGALVIISLHEKSLTLYQSGVPAGRFAIASGAYRTPSPIGVFRVTGRFAPSVPGGFGTRFLGLNVSWGQYGIHGTNKPSSIGSNASHGCIRMRSSDAEKLYSLVPTGTRVVIEGGPYGELDTHLRALSPGDRSSHVRAVQRRLRQLGFYTGGLDGVYGAGLSAAVRAARQTYGLAKSGNVDAAFYKAIGLILFE